MPPTDNENPHYTPPIEKGGYKGIFQKMLRPGPKFSL